MELLPAFAGVPQAGQVYHVDALALLRALPSGSVDAVITDLPYGTTACAWDNVIPFAPMWAGVKRVLKPRGVFVTTASQPFTSALVMSNPRWFRYGWVWVKNMGSNFAVTDYQPMKEHEDVLVFAVGTHSYHPQNIRRSEGGIARSKYPVNPSNNGKRQALNGFTEKYPRIMTELERVPSSVLRFNVERGNHPTQKPVALYRYLIETYTRPGELVLDFCCGSGTTAVAAFQCGRQFIAGDTCLEYVETARRRLRQTTPDMFATFGAA